jgi:RNA polymerase sigma-70 factor (ECF subfamily)
VEVVEMSALLGPAPVSRPTEPAELTRYLYEKYGQRVFTFCYSRLRNREEAQDAVQSTFVYVMRALQRGVEPDFELAWLLKIAFNVCRGTRRSTGRVAAVTQTVEDIDDLVGRPASTYESSERLTALRTALAHLPENQRRGILLREWQGLSYAEIADELGLSVGAVETLLFRARRNLASRLAHVRSGVGALNVATVAPFLRSLFRGGLGKLGLIGATASVALVPVIAARVAPAIADGKPRVSARPATAAASPLAPRARRGVKHAVTATAIGTGGLPSLGRAVSAQRATASAPSSSTDGGPAGAAGSAPLAPPDEANLRIPDPHLPGRDLGSIVAPATQASDTVLPAVTQQIGAASAAAGDVTHDLGK